MRPLPVSRTLRSMPGITRSSEYKDAVLYQLHPRRIPRRLLRICLMVVSRLLNFIYLFQTKEQLLIDW